MLFNRPAPGPYLAWPPCNHHPGWTQGPPSTAPDRRALSGVGTPAGSRSCIACAASVLHKPEASPGIKSSYPVDLAIRQEATTGKTKISNWNCNDITKYTTKDGRGFFSWQFLETEEGRFLKRETEAECRGQKTRREHVYTDVYKFVSKPQQTKHE